MTRSSIAIKASLAGLASLVVAALAAPASASEAPQPFSAPRDAASFDRALQCLTEAIYYEARSESEEGQRAVAQVVLNRVRHPSYPDTVCGVVYQGSHRRTGCQFTFTCDGSMGGYIHPGSWARAERIARAALQGSVYRPVGLALNYHTTAIRPYWAPSLVRQAVIGAHIFYRRPDSGSTDAFYQAPGSAEPAVGYAAAGSFRPMRATRSSPAVQALVERPRVERPRVERPRLERPLFQPPVSTRVARTQRASQPQTPAQAGPRGPRTTIENGVRVTRGS